jgi:soluble lytic murein transglycosylase-like protein
MKYLLIIMVLLFAIPAHSDIEQNLAAYITDFMSYKIGKKSMILYPKRLEKALSYIPTIIAECGDDIDPWLIAIIISRESAWRFDVTGQLGEIGLMQLMPKYVKGYDLSDPHEQIRAGVEHFRAAKSTCGNAKSAVNMRGCGKCKPHLKFVKRLWRYYLRIKRRYNR